MIMIGATLINLANIIFFLTSLTQMKSAYNNRKDLSAIPYWLLIGYLFACILFALGNACFGAYIAVVLNIICAYSFLLQIYWKLKYRK